MSDGNYQNHEQAQKSKQIDMSRITTIQAAYKTNEKVQLFVLWQILNKRYTIGSKLFFPELETRLGANKPAFSKAKMFLQGAGVLVDDVIISDKVPVNLIERFGLINEQTQSKD